MIFEHNQAVISRHNSDVVLSIKAHGTFWGGGGHDRELIILSRRSGCCAELHSHCHKLKYVRSIVQLIQNIFQVCKFE